MFVIKCCTLISFEHVGLYTVADIYRLGVFALCLCIFAVVQLLSLWGSVSRSNINVPLFHDRSSEISIVHINNPHKYSCIIKLRETCFVYIT